MIALDNQHFLIGESLVTRGHFPRHFPRPYREPPFEEWSTTARHCHHSCLQVPSWENGGPETVLSTVASWEIPKLNKSFIGKIIHKWWIFHCHVWASGWGTVPAFCCFLLGCCPAGGGFLGGRNNVLSLVSWFRHSWSYVPPFFPCNFHHVFNAIYARTFLCKFQYAFHAMLWTFVAMWMPPICSASTFQRKMLRPTDFVQVFFRAVERSSNGIVPISEPTITPKGQVLDIK